MTLKEYTKIFNTPGNEEKIWFSSVFDTDEVGPLCEIAFDSCERYKETDSEPFFFLRNGYTDDSEWIPFSVEEHPKPLLEFERKVSLMDYIKVLKLVGNNLDLIKEHCETKNDTFQLIRFLREKMESLHEMANLLPTQTGLPYDIWIDEGETFRRGKHWMRVKVKKEKGNYVTYTIPEHNWLHDDGMNGWEKRMVEKFVEYNEEDLMKLFQKQLTREQFLNRMIFVNDRGEPVNPEAKDEWYLYKNAGYGYRIVINSLDGKFNYMNKDGDIMLKNNADRCSDIFGFVDKIVCNTTENGYYCSYKIENHKFVLMSKEKIIDHEN